MNRCKPCLTHLCASTVVNIDNPDGFFEANADMTDVTGNIAAVFSFEWRRSLTFARLGWLVALSVFPAAVVLLINLALEGSSPQGQTDVGAWSMVLFVLGPVVVSMLGVFLWATPAISSELEQRSWVYLAVRPNGTTAILLGKYLFAVTWTLVPALAGLTVAVLLIPVEWDAAFRLWHTMARLILLATVSYGAIYMLIGVTIQKRAMVIAVAYSMVLEGVIAWIPAMVNQITIQFRLRSLLIRWGYLQDTELGKNFAAQKFFSGAPAWQHVMVLVVGIVVVLCISVAVLRFREFTSGAEVEL